jgi:phosphoglucomutase
MLTSTIQKEIHSWHLQESEPDLASELEELIQQSNENALNDAFYKTLSFGTAGIRGIMGVGTIA